MEDKALNTLDGFTIEEWREKYKLCDTARMNNALLAGERLESIQSWSGLAHSIFKECEIDWPLNVRFDVAIIEAFRALQKRNLDLSGDIGKLSAITVVALDLLKRFVQQSREPDEGDCVYCNCELGGGNEYHCYNDCIITEVRKLLDAVEKGQSVSVDRAVLHDLQENNWSIPEHEDEF